MSVQTTTGSEADRSTQLDTVDSTTEGSRRVTPGKKTTTATSAKRKTTTQEMTGFIDFTLELRVSIETPCKRFEYS